ncbi:hypothetical protein C8R42DRAFT_252996 [Lentinula raphanica]|nr:hypothetical protein C8R42DRAFT_252996 [Lentinula raphanica]
MILFSSFCFPVLRLTMVYPGLFVISFHIPYSILLISYFILRLPEDKVQSNFMQVQH